MKIYAFPLDADGLVDGKRRTLVDFGDEKGCDGMTVDAEGNIYLTVREPKRPGVMVIDPKGKELAFIPTGPADRTGATSPSGLPSNVEFGIGDEASGSTSRRLEPATASRSRFRGYHPQNPAD